MLKLGRTFPIAAILLAAACSGGDSRQGPSIQVEEGWARAMPLLAEDAGGASNSAVYMLIRNQGGEDDRLVGGESPASLRLEVHESRMENDVMRMRMLDGIDLPARGSVELAPGGLHLMLVGLTQALQEGDSVAVTLRFEKTGPMKVMVPIRLMGQR